LAISHSIDNDKYSKLENEIKFKEDRVAKLTEEHESITKVSNKV